MKIVHCLNHYLPASIGGTEIYVHNLALEQLRDGHDVTILVPLWNELTGWEVDGVFVKTFAVDKHITRDVRAGHSIPPGLGNFLNILSGLEPSFIHFHEFTQGNGLSYHHVLAASNAGFKTIVTLHLAGYTCKTGELMYMGAESCNGLALPTKCARCMYSHRGFSSFKNSMLHSLSTLFYKTGYDTSRWHNSAGTALSFPFQVKQAVDILKNISESVYKVVVLNNWFRKVLIVNGINDQKLVTIGQGLVHDRKVVLKERSFPPPLRLVYLGRIAQIKGLHILLKAVNELDPAAVTLDIYGKENNDPYNQHCRELTRLSKNIAWKGVLNPEEIIPTLSGYQVLVLPSLSEMSSLVIPEAFAACLPVLASSIPANREMIEEGKNGWFFKFNDVHDLKIKIEMLISRPQLAEPASLKFPLIRTFRDVWSEYSLLYNSVTVTA